ncbi:MAG: class I SAM-dependent methyltransferase [Tibeticola sp.]
MNPLAPNPWDERFAGPEYKYGTEPNAFLREQAALRLTAPAEVLVPGDGEGRNGVWLARQGHRVTSVDYSTVGLQKTQALAARHGVAVRTLQADLSVWAPPPGAFDAVVLIYVHLPAAFRRDAHRRLAQGLEPGGWLILEAFHPAQLAFDSGGPKDATMLYTPAMLDADFDGLLEPVLRWDGEVELAEGLGHQGRAHVTRWVGVLQILGKYACTPA